MKVTVDIPKEALEEAKRNTGTATHREAVSRAVEQVNRQHRMAKLVRHFGKYDGFITLRELIRRRKMK